MAEKFNNVGLWDITFYRFDDEGIVPESLEENLAELKSKNITPKFMYLISVCIIPILYNKNTSLSRLLFY